MTPDAWIDHLYAQDMVNLGERGFVLARIGGSNGDPQEVYPAGPWSDHTSTIAFTGDAWGTWNTLATEAALVPDEATIGEPYVSSDIGSYLGPPPTQSGADPPDLYDRWVQLGTFEPILRLHSNNENRLPWQYPQPVQGITESFLRLREALLPYTYTLAAEANQTGPADGTPALPRLPRSAVRLPEPDRVPLRAGHAGGPGDHARGRGVDHGVVPPGPVGRFLHRCHVHGAVHGHPGGATRPDAGLRPPGWDRSRAALHRRERGHPMRSPPSSTRDRRGPSTLYGDAGTGLGYTKGQRTETLITTSSAQPRRTAVRPGHDRCRSR